MSKKFHINKFSPKESLRTVAQRRVPSYDVTPMLWQFLCLYIILVLCRHLPKQGDVAAVTAVCRNSQNSRRSSLDPPLVRRSLYPDRSPTPNLKTLPQPQRRRRTHLTTLKHKWRLCGILYQIARFIFKCICYIRGTHLCVFR